MQKHLGHILTLLVMVLCLLLQESCVDRGNPKSELFSSIFIDDSSTFRNIFLGQNIREVLTKEDPHQPVHHDSFGLKYEFEVSPVCQIMIHYLPQSMKSGVSGSQRIASILANISLKSEVETARLYNEIEDHFNLLYGRENLTGKYGSYVWNCSQNYISSMEVRLALGENQKNIRVNFVDTQSGQINENQQANMLNN